MSSPTSEILLVEIEGADEPLRIMTKEQIRERDRLNVEVTASSIRRRVLSKQNGMHAFEGVADVLDLDR